MDAVLLAVGDEPLIVSRAGATKLLETSLDFGSAAIARGPEIPLLVNLMFERLLGSRLLDAIAIADRGTGSVEGRAVARADAERGRAVAERLAPAARLGATVARARAARAAVGNRRARPSVVPIDEFAGAESR